MSEFDHYVQLNSELNIVYRYLRKLGISHADSEDIVQETVYKYMLYYESINPVKTRSWLIRVALNFHYDQCRKQSRYELNLSENLLLMNEKETPEQILLEKENIKVLDFALSKLKPYFQELLLLKYHSGLSYNDMATLLNCSISSIKSNLFRARKQLAKVYKEVNHE